MPLSSRAGDYERLREWLEENPMTRAEFHVLMLDQFTYKTETGTHTRYTSLDRLEDAVSSSFIEERTPIGRLRSHRGEMAETENVERVFTRNRVVYSPDRLHRRHFRDTRTGRFARRPS